MRSAYISVNGERFSPNFGFRDVVARGDVGVLRYDVGCRDYTLCHNLKTSEN